MNKALHYLSFAILALLTAGASQPVSPLSAVANADGQIVVKDEGVAINFPNGMIFSANVSAPEGIERVVLEYGTEQVTCGTVTAKAFPQFESGPTAEVAWTWEMRKSGSEPPGARVWYRWRVTDKKGHVTLSDKQTVTWIDQNHNWTSLTQGGLTLHWYQGNQSFARSLLDSANESLAQLKEQTGVDLQSPVDLYVYASTADLQHAVLYEPGWTGGLAYAEYGIVLIGISPANVEWGKHAEAHELTHVLVGHLAFSCLGTIPTWLNEGMAMYGQGGPEPESLSRLNDAIKTDNLMTIQSLSGQFSESSDKADLSYAQSFSIVNYLVTHFGQEKINTLFRDLARGLAIDAALRDVYGFGLDGLEAGWRASMGAPAPKSGPAVVATIIPTAVPTYPLQGIPTAPTAAHTHAESQDQPETMPTEEVTGSPVAAAPTDSSEAATSETMPDGRTSEPLMLAALFLLPIVPALAGGYVYLRNRESR